VQAGNQYAFSTGPLLTTSGGTLELYSFDFTFADLSGTGGTVGNFSGSPCTLTVGTDNTSTSYGGTIVDGTTSASLALTKVGSGTLTLTVNNSFSGGTIVSNGALSVLGSLSGSGAVAVTAGAALGGSGMIAGAVSIAPGGTLHAGTLSNLGTLSISNTLTLSGTAVMKISKTGGVLTNDLVQGLQGVTYGGMLVVTNVTSDATALAAGDTFTLFSSTGYTPGFVSTNLPALASGLAWNTTNLTVNGSLQVVATVNPNPTNLTAKRSGSTLTLSWPADHTGWRLLVQTNRLASGISANTNDWMTVAGSTGMDQTNININPVQSAEFYRLVYP